jgi:hypothetical protein
MFSASRRYVAATHSMCMQYTVLSPLHIKRSSFKIDKKKNRPWIESTVTEVLTLSTLRTLFSHHMDSRLFITAQTEESPEAKRACTISPAEINLRLLWCHHLCRVCPFPRNKRNDVIGRFARLFFPRRKMPTLLSSAITPYIVLNLTCISSFPGFYTLRVPSRCPRF